MVQQNRKELYVNRSKTAVGRIGRTNDPDDVYYRYFTTLITDDFEVKKAFPSMFVIYYLRTSGFTPAECPTFTSPSEVMESFFVTNNLFLTPEESDQLEKGDLIFFDDNPTRIGIINRIGTEYIHFVTLRTETTLDIYNIQYSMILKSAAQIKGYGKIKPKDSWG